MRALEFLIERNILNVEDIDTFVRHVADMARTDGVRRWISAKLPAWLRRKYDRTEKATAEDVLRRFPNVPDWAEKALNQNDLDKILLDQRLTEQIRQIIDYLESEVAVGHNLSRMSVEVAAQKSQEWHRQLARQSQKSSEIASSRENQKVLRRYGNGYEWVELLTPSCLDVEGQKMGHCVGGGAYDEVLRSGHVRIISLRDPNDEPHVTVEIRNGAIAQVKGKQNKPPIDTYHQAVIDLLNNVFEGRIESDTNDLHPMGIFRGKNRYGRLDQIAKRTDLESGHSLFEGILAGDGKELALLKDQQKKTLAELAFEGSKLYQIIFHAPAKWISGDIREILPKIRDFTDFAKQELQKVFGIDVRSGQPLHQQRGFRLLDRDGEFRLYRGRSEFFILDNDDHPVTHATIVEEGSTKTLTSITTDEGAEKALPLLFRQMKQQGIGAPEYIKASIGRLGFFTTNDDEFLSGKEIEETGEFFSRSTNGAWYLVGRNPTDSLRGKLVLVVSGLVRISLRVRQKRDLLVCESLATHAHFKGQSADVIDLFETGRVAVDRDYEDEAFLLDADVFVDPNDTFMEIDWDEEVRLTSEFINEDGHVVGKSEITTSMSDALNNYLGLSGENSLLQRAFGRLYNFDAFVEEREIDGDDDEERFYDDPNAYREDFLKPGDQLPPVTLETITVER